MMGHRFAVELAAALRCETQIGGARPNGTRFDLRSNRSIRENDHRDIMDNLRGIDDMMNRSGDHSEEYDILLHREDH